MSRDAGEHRTRASIPSFPIPTFEPLSNDVMPRQRAPVRPFPRAPKPRTVDPTHEPDLTSRVPVSTPSAASRAPSAAGASSRATSACRSARSHGAVHTGRIPWADRAWALDPLKHDAGS
jgi:hypothetical protein